ncbi:hypothetical protein KR009_002781 [Drosophila setifemur]|nr:hypothetical protein KR009_002781 [Drosophila setifemur]
MVKDSSHPHGEPAPKLVTELEMEERQKKYMSRLHDIEFTCSNFKNALALFRELEYERAELRQWEQYVRCDNLPKPEAPVEVRTFLAKIRHFEEIEVNSSIDWTLSVDERSILTQDMFRVDKSRMHLEKTLADNPGLYFEKNSRDCLEALRQIDNIMDSDVEMESLSKKTQMDILEVYGDLQKEIVSLFDRLTYRILRTQKVYMHTIDGIVAKWSHTCKAWSIDLWGFLNVSIIFAQMDVPMVRADFQASGVGVQVPMSVLGDCLTMRCVHTSFDHYSQNAKSFEPLVIDPELIPSAGIRDMRDSAISEWAMQQYMIDEFLENMLRKREEYENMLKLIVERTDQAAKAQKADKDNASKVVIPKTPKVVPPIPPDMVPDVYDEFIKREELEFRLFLDEVFHPRFLKLDENEVNLRECIILGGIYSIMFVRRPEQTQFQSFNIILHEDGRVLHTMPEVVATISPKSRISEMSRSSMRHSMMQLDESELPYFVVTLKLPPDLCRWGQPEVCQYMTEMGPGSANEERISRFSVSDIHRESTYSNRSESSRTTSMMLNDFAPSIKSILRQSRLSTRIHRVIRQKDFDLEHTLTKMEMQSLGRICLPRLISSFKLPYDFNNNALEAELQKGKPNRLLKRGDAADVSDAAPLIDTFDFDTQDGPERLFPVFGDIIPVQFDSTDLPASVDPKKTASGMEAILDDIKFKYLAGPTKMWNQQDLYVKKPRKTVEREKDNDEEPDPKIVTIPAEKSPRAHERPEKLERRKSRLSKLKPIQVPNRVVAEKQIEDDEPVDDERQVPVTHWTTKYIHGVEINLEQNTLTFKTDRLGIFGLAFKRYEHFPFRDWCLQPNEENPEEVVLSLDTFHVRIFLYISSKGVRGYATEITKGYTAKPVKFVDVAEPISDFREFRKIFVGKNINIFAENDASFYIEKGYFSIKHVATEHHTYNSMALHCRSMKFYRSNWNRLSQRRDIVLDMKIARDTSEYSEVTMRVTPEVTTFVKIKEMCTDNIDVVKLSYEQTWRNVNVYTDLNHAIHSMNPHAQDEINKDALLFAFIQRILGEIRPLSYA